MTGGLPRRAPDRPRAAYETIVSTWYAMHSARESQVMTNGDRAIDNRSPCPHRHSLSLQRRDVWLK